MVIEILTSWCLPLSRVKKKTDIDIRNNKVDLILTGQITLSPATGRQLLGQQKFTSFPDA